MARRSANGEGSLYQRQDGRWEGAVYCLTTSGTRKRVRVYGGSRGEAHDKLVTLKAKLSLGIGVADKSWRIGEYLDYWLTDVVRPNRRPATFDQCETIVRLYLRPGLGRQWLRTLSVPQVQLFLNGHLAAGRSIATTLVIRKVLSSALTRAQREELVTRNVARLAELPGWQQPEVQPWSVEEALRFLRKTSEEVRHPAYLLLLTYGLRRGELLGLRWQDIDVEQAEIHVRQQLQRVGGELHLGPLKTSAGRRDLPLLSTVAEALRVHRRRQVRTDDSRDLVFTSSAGTPVEPRNFSRDFAVACSRHCIRPITVHALRHTTATLLKNLGVPARDAQRILGHARITTTQELYQHTDMPAQRRALEGVAAALSMESEDRTSRDDERPGKVTAVVDGYGSRQNSRQGSYLHELFTWIVSGAGSGTLTHDLFLGKSPPRNNTGRITEVKMLLRTRTQTWLLGAVAVNLAVI